MLFQTICAKFNGRDSIELLYSKTCPNAKPENMMKKLIRIKHFSIIALMLFCLKSKSQVFKQIDTILKSSENNYLVAKGIKSFK